MRTEVLAGEGTPVLEKEEGRREQDKEGFRGYKSEGREINRGKGEGNKREENKGWK